MNWATKKKGGQYPVQPTLSDTDKYHHMTDLPPPYTEPGQVNLTTSGTIDPNKNVMYGGVGAPLVVQPIPQGATYVIVPPRYRELPSQGICQHCRAR